MKTFLYIIAIAFLMVSCGGSKKTVTKETTVKDSVSTVTTIVPRDTLITIPKDSIALKVKLDKLTEKPITKTSKTGKVKAKVSRVKDEIIVQCDTDSLELELELKDKIINTLRSRETNTSEVIEVPVKYTPWWKNLLAVIGGIALAYIAGFIGAKLIKI